MDEATVAMEVIAVVMEAMAMVDTVDAVALDVDTDVAAVALDVDTDVAAVAPEQDMAVKDKHIIPGQRPSVPWGEAIRHIYVRNSIG